jgi:hypothetical protein
MSLLFRDKSSTLDTALSEEKSEIRNKTQEETKSDPPIVNNTLGYSTEYPDDIVSTNFFFWRDYYPELEEIYLNQEAIIQEAKTIPQVRFPESLYLHI